MTTISKTAISVGILDYGSGNIGSVFRALHELHARPVLIKNPGEIKRFDRLILPGVGNFLDCANLLAKGGWRDALREEVLVNKRGLLGICVGMQLLANFSMEGSETTDSDGAQGLGLIPGKVIHLRDCGCVERVPHMGWNSIKLSAEHSHLLLDIPDETDFYFAHSYTFITCHTEDVIATAHHGIPFTAAVHRDNVWGTQFHPEKSSKAGFQLLDNFVSEPRC
jgi:imidazole glycerol-phosphate synthase subunit HisH